MLSPAFSQPDDGTSPLDKPFSRPQYWLHATGHGTMDGPRTDDWWFLFPQQPKDGFIELPDGYGGTFTYSIDQASGSFNTPKEACQAAPPATSKWVSMDEWGSSQSFTCSDDASCQTECKGRGPHQIWNGKDEYPYCNCVCESGWKFDALGKRCVPIQTPSAGAGDNAALVSVATPQGASPLKPGERVQIILASGESVSLEVFCRELQKKIGIMSAIYVSSKKMSMSETSLALGLISANEYICNKKVVYNLDYAGTSNPYGTSGTSSSTGSPSVEIKIDLQAGSLRAEVLDDQVALDIETPTRTVSSQGVNAFEVDYDPESQKSFVAAYQHPVQIQPADGNQAPFALVPGDEVEVGTGQSEYATPQAQTSGGWGKTGIPGPTPGTDEVSEGGCYADPMTGEIVCVDSSGQPSTTQVEPSTTQDGVQGGCYQDPSTGQFVCVDY